jgi:uncharacterized glyoxalase superfamily protein PhnB
MATTGVDHLYFETRSWDRSVAFWKELGYEVEFATDHGSGMLRHPAGGPTVFLAEQSDEDPLATAVYLGVADAAALAAGTIEVVRPFTPTHWGTQVAIVRDPDGRELRLEAPAP